MCACGFYDGDFFICVFSVLSGGLVFLLLDGTFPPLETSPFGGLGRSVYEPGLLWLGTV